MRLIDANALMKRIEEVYCKDCNSHNGVMCRACAHMDDMDFIEDAPTTDAQPVKRGKWIDVDYKTLGHGFLETYPNDGVCCSECRTGFKKSRLLIRSYCPNCGSYNGD